MLLSALIQNKEYLKTELWRKKEEIKSLKEVIAFPLTSDGRDPMMDSPSKVNKDQLDELGLQKK